MSYHVFPYLFLSVPYSPNPGSFGSVPSGQVYNLSPGSIYQSVGSSPTRAQNGQNNLVNSGTLYSVPTQSGSFTQQQQQFNANNFGTNSGSTSSIGGNAVLTSQAPPAGSSGTVPAGTTYTLTSGSRYSLNGGNTVQTVPFGSTAHVPAGAQYRYISIVKKNILADRSYLYVWVSLFPSKCSIFS